MNNYDGFKCIIFLLLTICLGLNFSFIQYFEYNFSIISFSDSVFGSVLFILTGFHGIHVIIGNIFLLVSLFRIFKDHFTKESHKGYIFSVYY